MMSDTYQRIQAQSDIEWKYGLAKLIRNMHRTTTTPSPLNLITSWFMYLLQLCKQKGECLAIKYVNYIFSFFHIRANLPPYIDYKIR